MADPVTSPLQIGVVGTGAMGREHLRNIVALPGAVVSAVTDPDPASLRLACWAVSPHDVPAYTELGDSANEKKYSAMFKRAEGGGG